MVVSECLFKNVSKLKVGWEQELMQLYRKQAWRSSVFKTLLCSGKKGFVLLEAVRCTREMLSVSTQSSRGCRGEKEHTLEVNKVSCAVYYIYWFVLFFFNWLLTFEMLPCSSIKVVTKLTCLKVVGFLQKWKLVSSLNFFNRCTQTSKQYIKLFMPQI